LNFGAAAGSRLAAKLQMVRRGASLDANQAWWQLSGRTPSLDQLPRSLLSFNLTGVGSWPSKRHAGSILSAAVAPRVRPRSRLPRSVYFESVEMLMRRSSRHRRNLAHSAAIFSKPSTIRDCQGVYALVSMTGLKVSVTASIGTQARHRMLRFSTGRLKPRISHQSRPKLKRRKLLKLRYGPVVRDITPNK
jgi:hypothetical protein